MHPSYPTRSVQAVNVLTFGSVGYFLGLLHVLLPCVWYLTQNGYYIGSFEWFLACFCLSWWNVVFLSVHLCSSGSSEFKIRRVNAEWEWCWTSWGYVVRNGAYWCLCMLLISKPVHVLLVFLTKKHDQGNKATYRKCLPKNTYLKKSVMISIGLDFFWCWNLSFL